MILRRITEHLRKQHWTAIAIDFVIVVLGVFVGLQANSWNGEREDRRAERAVLHNLQADFTEIASTLNGKTPQLRGRRDAARYLIVALRQERPPSNDTIFRDSIAQVFYVETPAHRSSTYVRLLSTGDIRLLRDEHLRALLDNYDQALDRNGPYTTAAFETVMSDAPIFDALDVDPDTGAVRSYDFNKLKTLRGRLEFLLLIHTNTLDAELKAEHLAEEIKAEIAREEGASS